MGIKIRLQLSTMMFLQFFVWGTWYVTMGTYLFKVGFTGIEIGAAYSTINWGAIVSPFFVGIIADRFFSAQKVMAAIHLTGAVILFYLALFGEYHGSICFFLDFIVVLIALYADTSIG
jgi:MFS family permease